MAMASGSPRLAHSGWWLAAALCLSVGVASAAVAQGKPEVQVAARKYTYVITGANEPVIRVKQDDLVSITLTAEDIAHSFTVSDDHYRIDRRAEPGKPVTFRFRADKVGTFEIRCTLTLDERCLREMRGRLIVATK
jgi:heme/copper-type cytochrome/quinol oxidase subunit 2